MVDVERVLDAGEDPGDQVPIEVVDDVDEGEDAQRVARARKSAADPGRRGHGGVGGGHPSDSQRFEQDSPAKPPVRDPCSGCAEVEERGLEEQRPGGQHVRPLRLHPGQRPSDGDRHRAESRPHRGHVLERQPATMHPGGVVRLDGVGDGVEAGDGARHTHDPDLAGEGRQRSQRQADRGADRVLLGLARGIGLHATLGQPDRADVQAGAEAHRPALAVHELGGASPHVDCQQARLPGTGGEVLGHRQIREPGLLVAREDLHRGPRTLAGPGQELGPVPCVSRRGGGGHHHRPGSRPAREVGEAAQHLERGLLSLGGEEAGAVDPASETGDLRLLAHRVEHAVRAALRHQQQHRVGSDVHGGQPAHASDQTMSAEGTTWTFHRPAEKPSSTRLWWATICANDSCLRVAGGVPVRGQHHVAEERDGAAAGGVDAVLGHAPGDDQPPDLLGVQQLGQLRLEEGVAAPLVHHRLAPRGATSGRISHPGEPRSSRWPSAPSCCTWMTGNPLRRARSSNPAMRSTVCSSAACAAAPPLPSRMLR